MWLKIRAWLKRAMYSPAVLGIQARGRQDQVPAWKYDQVLAELAQLRARHEAVVAGYSAHLNACDVPGDDPVAS
jgi:hypothetical protein